MQKIFYNANCLTFNDSLDLAEAFFCNDESLVLIGSNEEVKSMKVDEMLEIDLDEKTIIPTFFDTNAHVFDIIEERLKTAKKDNFLEKIHEKDENYETFDNFEHYLNEFLIIQNDYIKNGITTIFEMNITSRSFPFWKKLSEKNLLKIDVVGYVDILSSKDVMDNNCRSYRKYKNHFRLGGYTLAIDGDITLKKAWISKPYRHEKTYTGFSSILGEHLKFLIKTTIEEKKQLFVEANGDKALDLFLSVADEVYNEKKDDDKFLPVIKNCNFITKRQMRKIKELQIALDFDISIISDNHKIKSMLRFFRRKKLLQIKKLSKSGIPILFHSKDNLVSNGFEIASMISSGGMKTNKFNANKKQLESFDVLKSLIKTASIYCFDGEQKGSLESGKLANFLVLNENITESNLNEIIVEKVYIESNLIYDIKNKN